MIRLFSPCSSLRGDWGRHWTAAQVPTKVPTRTQRRGLANEADLFNPPVFTLSISVSHAHKPEDKLMRLTFLSLPRHVLLGRCAYLCVWVGGTCWLAPNRRSSIRSESLNCGTNTQRGPLLTSAETANQGTMWPEGALCPLWLRQRCSGYCHD